MIQNIVAISKLIVSKAWNV